MASRLSTSKVLHQIGKGTHGDVSICHQREQPDQKYVYKRINLNDLTPKDTVAAVSEVKILRELSSPCIVKYIDSFVDTSHLTIIMEYCEGGDLSEFIQRRKKAQIPFKKKEIKNILYQMVIALDQCHSKNIIHRNIQTSNIFISLSDKNQMKLGGFGIGRTENPITTMKTTEIGTNTLFYYLAPEICRGQSYSKEADIWSLGCVIYELMNMHRPFEGTHITSLVIAITSGSFEPVCDNYKDIYSKQLQKLVWMMLSLNPNNRPTTKQILNAPFLAKMKQKYDGLWNQHRKSSSTCSNTNYRLGLSREYGELERLLNDLPRMSALDKIRSISQMRNRPSFLGPLIMSDDSADAIIYNKRASRKSSRKRSMRDRLPPLIMSSDSEDAIIYNDRVSRKSKKASMKPTLPPLMMSDDSSDAIIEYAPERPRRTKKMSKTKKKKITIKQGWNTSTDPEEERKKMEKRAAIEKRKKMREQQLDDLRQRMKQGRKKRKKKSVKVEILESKHKQSRTKKSERKSKALQESEKQKEELEKRKEELLEERRRTTEAKINLAAKQDDELQKQMDMLLYLKEQEAYMKEKAEHRKKKRQREKQRNKFRKHIQELRNQSSRKQSIQFEILESKHKPSKSARSSFTSCELENNEQIKTEKRRLTELRIHIDQQKKRVTAAANEIEVLMNASEPSSERQQSRAKAEIIREEMEKKLGFARFLLLHKQAKRLKEADEEWKIKQCFIPAERHLIGKMKELLALEAG